MKKSATLKCMTAPVACDRNGMTSLTIGSRLLGGWSLAGRRLRSEDAVVDRQPYEHNAIADSIEHLPPDTTDRFEHRVSDLPDDLGCL